MNSENQMIKTCQLIKDFRIKAGFTQQSLAEALHVTDKAVSKWERGICLPDTMLLPKLALILDIDLGMLISMSINVNDWVGFIDIKDCDFSQLIYDKPILNYLLSHYLLLGINNIYINTDENNIKLLKDKYFSKLGFKFSFNKPKNKNVMLLNKPWFLFGSDLTEQYQGAILSNRLIKLIPENQSTIFYFVPSEYNYMLDNVKTLEKKATKKTLGRGMIAFDMSNYDNLPDISSFVRIYQKNTGLDIANLEEIYYNLTHLNHK